MINRNIKRIFKGSLISIIGFILSPFSWWNDLLVNIPIAYFLSVLTLKILPGNLALYMVIYYWLSNILGLIMFHTGVETTLNKTGEDVTKKKIIKNCVVASFYSLIIVILVLTGILKLPAEYFGTKPF